VPLRLAVLGPAGRWRLVEGRGVAGLSSQSGRVGDTLSVTPAMTGDWAIILEYTGATTVSPRGETRAAGAPSRFGYRHFEPATRWAARFFTWTDSTELAKGPEAFSRMASAAPRLSRELSRLDIQWYRPRMPELPIEHWGLEATATVALPPGSYRIRTISDDGIRVWVDGRLVIERWSTHESTVDEAPLAGGRHDLKVQYYQNGGWTELRVEIVESDQPSSG
jgi:hypothetical protein